MSQLSLFTRALHLVKSDHISFNYINVDCLYIFLTFFLFTNRLFFKVIRVMIHWIILVVIFVFSLLWNLFFHFTWYEFNFLCVWHCTFLVFNFLDSFDISIFVSIIYHSHKGFTFILQIHLPPHILKIHILLAVLKCHFWALYSNIYVLIMDFLTIFFSLLLVFWYTSVVFKYIHRIMQSLLLFSSRIFSLHLKETLYLWAVTPRFLFSQLLVTTNLLSVSRDLPIWKFHINGII